MPGRWIRRIMTGILTRTFTGLIELTAEYWIRQNAVFEINESIRSIRGGQRPVIMTEMTVAVPMINDRRSIEFDLSSRTPQVKLSFNHSGVSDWSNEFTRQSSDFTWKSNLPNLIVIDESQAIHKDVTALPTKKKQKAPYAAEAGNLSAESYRFHDNRTFLLRTETRRCRCGR